MTNFNNPSYAKVTDEAILGFFGEFRFLSNFYPSRIQLGEVSFLNAEAAFQAQKSTDLNVQTKFSKLEPGPAKSLGRKITLRKDWEEVKTSIMEEVVRAKFTQNPELSKLLLATRQKSLVEVNHWNDRCWGQDLTGRGENRLGKILEKIREELTK